MKKKAKSSKPGRANRSRVRGKRQESKRKQHNNKDADVTDRSTLDVALQYAAAGLPVLPMHGKDWSRRCTCGDPKCSQPGSHPRVKHATTDPALVTRYWTESPDAEIGVPLGSSSGIVALVVNGPTGRQTLRSLEEKAK
jgi:bifunctional DNA primase/polymerase-like protein